MGLHWYMLSAALVLVLQAFVFRRFGRRRLTYSRSFGAVSAYCGDTVELIEEIGNRKWLPVPWLRVESQLRTGLEFGSQENLEISSGSIYQNHKSFFSLLPYTKITRRHKLVCARRGVYRLSAVSLTVGDVLGISTATERKDVEGELLVYPLPADVSALPADTRSWQGDITVRRWIVDDPFMIAGVREYRSGDPLKGVNWKATARSGRLQVHQLDFTADHRLMIVLNMENHEGMWQRVNDEPLIEYGLSLAAGYARLAVAQGMEAGFAVNAPVEPGAERPIVLLPEGGRGRLEELFEAMARMPMECSVPVYLVLEQLAELESRRMDILLLTAFESVRMLEAVEELRRRGHSVDLLPLRQPESAAAGKGGVPA